MRYENTVENALHSYYSFCCAFTEEKSERKYTDDESSRDFVGERETERERERERERELKGHQREKEREREAQTHASNCTTG